MPEPQPDSYAETKRLFADKNALQAKILEEVKTQFGDVLRKDEIWRLVIARFLNREKWASFYLGDQGGSFVLRNVPEGVCIRDFDGEQKICELYPTCCEPEYPCVDWTEFIASNNPQFIADHLEELARLRRATGFTLDTPQSAG